MKNGVQRAVLIISLIASAGLAAPPAKAADCNQASNYLTNCDFTTDLSDWALTDGDSWTYIAADGATSPGCAEVDARDTGTYFGAGIRHFLDTRDCHMIAGGTTFQAGFTARYDAGSPGIQCQVRIYQFFTSTCQGLIGIVSGPDTPIGNTWTEVFSPGLVTDETALSATFEVYCNHSEDYEIRLDDILWGENVVPVELVSLTLE